jgi:hypothetical protein
MPPKPRGRPPKKRRNITGLQNSSSSSTVLLVTSSPHKVAKLRAKCSPICPIENTNCCMARLLSQQDDFKNQPSMLETFIHSRGHECMFLPKFHCELNPIEMVCSIHFKHMIQVLIKTVSTGVGANTVIGRWKRKPSTTPRKQRSASSKNVQRRLYSVS